MHRLSFLLLLLALAPAARGENATPSTLPPGFGAGADQIQTLRMAGHLNIQVSLPHTTTNLVRPYLLHFERPGRLSIIQPDHTLVANGTTLVVQASSGNLIRYAEIPQTQELERLSAFLSANRSPLNEIAALVSRDAVAFWQQALSGKNVEQLPDEAVGETTCRVYRWELMNFKERALGVRVWMDPTYGLVRRMRTEWVKAEADLPENLESFPTLEMNFDEITINQPLPADAFVFTPAAGARRMRNPERLFLRRLPATHTEALGKPAPDFSLDLLDGTSFQLAAQTGRVVVIDFWATWCGPCLRALPAVNQLARDYQGRGVVFLGLSSDEPAQRDQVRQTASSNHLVYAVGLDTNNLGKAFGVSGIPHLAVIDGQGLLQFIHVGYDVALTNKLARVLDQLLAGQTPTREVLLSEDEKTALAEEEADAALRRASLSKPDLDPALFTRRWTHPAGSLRRNTLPRPTAVHLAPPTYAILADRQLVVVDAGDGKVLHRIPLPAEVSQPDLLDQAPTGVFLRDGTNGVGVVLQHIYEKERIREISAYRTANSLVTGVGLGGEIRWQTRLDGNVQSLDTVPGKDGTDQLLLTAWNEHRLLNADGTPAATWNTQPVINRWILEGAEPGRLALLLFGSETTLFELRDPAPEGTP